MSLRNASMLLNTHPQLGAFALWAAARVSYDLWVDSGFRSSAEQDALFSQGRDANGQVTGTVATNARGGQSAHNFGLAIDVGPWAPERSDNLATADDPRYDELGALAKQFGLVWGGDFTLADGSHDPDHFEVQDWPQKTAWRRNIIAAVVVLAMLLVLFAMGGSSGGTSA